MPLRSLAFLDQARKYAAQKNLEFSNLLRAHSAFLFFGALPEMNIRAKQLATQRLNNHAEIQSDRGSLTK